MHKPLFLFMYHKNDVVTRSTYNQLEKTESRHSIVPICEYNSYLPNTYNCSTEPWQFHHHETWVRADSLIYKYVLEKARYVRKHSAVVILEWDVWWNPVSTEWINRTLADADMAGPEIMTQQRDPGWGWFNESCNNMIKKYMLGIRPFSVIICRPEILVKASKFIRDNKFMHNVKNCELRFATAFNAVQGKIGLLPDKYAKTIKWHEWDLNCGKQDVIIHPVKTESQLLRVR